MSELVADCPRCGSKRITFELTQANSLGKKGSWQRWYEGFCICRNCSQSTVFVLAQNQPSQFHDEVCKNNLIKSDITLNQFFTVERFISLVDLTTMDPPEHLPQEIDAIYREGLKCHSIGCHNAAGCMFRLCIDLVTKKILPKEGEDGFDPQLMKKPLGPRLEFIFKKGLLPESLKELSFCIKDDGNDGAHQGLLTKEDIDDIIDFTFTLLERLYTEPQKLALAKERRINRRK
jgi:hypothetical protein